jgi:site-specific DNA recombinase
MGSTKQGQAPFGYRWQGGQLRLNEQEAATRRTAFDLFISLKSKSAVARALNDQKRFTRSGKDWSDVQIGRILECSSAIGRYEINRTAVGDDGKRMATGSAARSVVACEPIVTQKVWSRTAEILRAKRTARKADPEVTLAGLVRCRCGIQMSHSAERAEFRCSKCATTLGLDDLEAIFSGDFGETLKAHPQLALGLVGDSEAGQIMSKIAHLEVSLSEFETERAAAEKMFAVGAVTRQRFEQLQQPAEEGIARTQKELSALKRELAGTPTAKEPPSWEDFWGGLPPERRIRIIRAFVDQFTVGEGEIEIAYLIPDAETAEDTVEPRTMPVAPHGVKTDGPVYIRLPKPGELCAYTGLSRAKMNDLILANARNNFRPPVASKSLRQPGQQRGVRLILLESLMSYLHSTG